MKPLALLGREAWIFDLDGTLTVAVHDFDAIRAELGLPADRPILESLQELTAEQAAPKRRRLDVIERELALDAVAAPGAADFLGELQARGRRLGILTRNSLANATLTLEACGLAAFFDPAERITRDHGRVKPDPDGIHHLLRRWNATPDDAVMVGDFRFDLEAGRAAGCATVHVDPSGAFPWPELADRQVRSLDALLAELVRA